MADKSAEAHHGGGVALSLRLPDLAACAYPPDWTDEEQRAHLAAWRAAPVRRLKATPVPVVAPNLTPAPKRLDLLTVYTAGYGGRGIEELLAAGKRLRAEGAAPLLVDIRYKPWSKQPGWGKRELQERLKARYRHVPELGNANAGIQGAPIEIPLLERGLDLICQLLESGETPILLCGCRKPAGCHRSIVSSALHQRGVITQELWAD